MDFRSGIQQTYELCNKVGVDFPRSGSVPSEHLILRSFQCSLKSSEMTIWSFVTFCGAVDNYKSRAHFDRTAPNSSKKMPHRASLDNIRHIPGRKYLLTCDLYFESN